MKLLTHALHIGLCGLLLMSNMYAAHAQETSEVLEVKTGEVFEMVVQHSFASPEYSWTLSKDGQLKKATNSQIFSVRLTEPGNYILEAELIDVFEQKRLKREFYLRVQASEPTTATTSSISVYPPLDYANRLALDTEEQIIVIQPPTDSTGSYTLDLDSTVDSNNDGDPMNDQYANGSAFSTNGTPLRVWLSEQTSTSIAVQGNGQTLQFAVLTPAEIAEQNSEKEEEEEYNPAIQVVRFGTNQYGFSIDATGQTWEYEPVLFEWTLGDGTETLHDTPIHTFSSSTAMQQVIQVDVRSLMTGKIIDSLKTKVDLEAVEITSSSSSTSSTESQSSESESSTSSIPVASSSESSTEQNNQDSSSGSGLLGLLIKIILIGLGSILAGFLLVFIFGLFKRIGGIQGAIEKSEEKLLPKEPQPEVVDAMPLPVEPETQKEKSVKTSTEVEQVTPVTEQNVVQTTSSESPAPTSPKEQPLPDWLQTSEDSTTPTKTEVPVEPSQTVAPASAPTPPWLQTTPTTPPVEDAGTPAVKQEKVVPEQAKQETSPQESAPKSDAPLPDWLQPNYIPKETPEKPKAEQKPKSTEVSNEATTSSNEPVKHSTMPDSTKTMQQSVQVSAEPKEVKVEDTAKKTTQPSTDESNKSYEIDPEVWATMSEEERERERKRLKRKRYRANKKQRDNNEDQKVTSPKAQVASTASPEVAKSVETESATKTKEESPAPTKQVPTPPAAPPKTPDTKGAPAWLAEGLDAAAATGQTQDNPPPSTLKDVPLATKDVTPAEPDDIEFIVRAESLDEEQNGDDSKKA